ncbi:MAG: FadR family transcriptional regulator [Desulfofustis sp.]|nr:FadR family transcriptional regulator [Desulfofustis sp.]
MFAPARQSKTTDIIIEDIRTAILAGKLQPGDRLPAEKELSQQFQVSRQTMRESLRALEHLGLITLRKGSGGGAFIKAVDAEVAVQSLANYLYFKNLTIANLSEMRRLLEPHAAACAAQRISAVDLQRLAIINKQTRQAMDNRDLELVTGSEIEFHRVIARQTDNPILLLVLAFVETLLEDFKKILQPDQIFMEAVLASHETILQAIVNRDETHAAEQMLDHIQAVERQLAQLKQDKNGSRLWCNCLQTPENKAAHPGAAKNNSPEPRPPAVFC